MATPNLPLEDNDTLSQYLSTGETIFTYDFPILEATDVKVSIDQVLQVHNTDYTLTGLGDAAGGTVVFTNPTTAGEIITIWQEMLIKRETGFALGAAVLLGESLNTEFIRQVRHDLQLARDIRLALRLAPDDPDSGQSMIIPTKATRAGQFLVFDASGNPTVSAGSGGGDTSLRTDLAADDTTKGNRLVAIPKDADEAGVTVVNIYEPIGEVLRYGTNTTPGTTEMATAFEAARDVMALKGAAASVTPGTYKITGTVAGDFYSVGLVTIVTGTVNYIANNSPISGVFTLDFPTGFTTVEAADVQYTRSGNLVTLRFKDQLLAVSNTATLVCFAGNVPAVIRPESGGGSCVMPMTIQDNSAYVHGLVNITNTGTLTFHSDLTTFGTPFTASGNKGYPAGQCVTYLLNSAA